MNFVKPGDKDDEDDAELVTLAWDSEEEPTEHTVGSAAKANAAQLQTAQETIDELQTLVEEQQEIITEQHERIEGLQSEVDSLLDRVDDHQSELVDQRDEFANLREKVGELRNLDTAVESLDARVDEIEELLPDLDTRVSGTEGDLARLRTAVFDEEQPCPECSSGRIGRAGGLTEAYKLVCNECAYEESTIIR